MKTELASWAQAQRGRQIFMHSINHPAKSLLAEYAHQLVVQAGLPSAHYAERFAQDEFLFYAVWPVYPAIGHHLGVEGNYLFKSPNTRAHPDVIRVHDLPSFLETSFGIFANADGLRCERIEVAPFITLTLRIKHPSPITTDFAAFGSPAEARCRTRRTDGRQESHGPPLLTRILPTRSSGVAASRA
jgi:hypothetical protein